MIIAVVSEEIARPEIERTIFAGTVIVPFARPRTRPVAVLDRRRPIIVPGGEGAAENDPKAKADRGCAAVIVVMIVMMIMTTAPGSESPTTDAHSAAAMNDLTDMIPHFLVDHIMTMIDALGRCNECKLNGG